MFSTWASGGTLVLVSEEVRRDPAALLALLIEERIERLFQPFVALQQLAEAAVSRGRVPVSLRDLITAGEQLQVTAAVAELFRRLPKARLWNQYGPTETHVATALLLAGAPEDPARWPALPPIGRPIAGHRVRLLDRDLLPVPAGVAAELAIGGAGLARGYLGRPDLTAERFIPDPCADEPGERLYRTGDLARYLPGGLSGPDGMLEYLGRIDRQIKVRGHRVEPGEIEAVIASQPGVRAVAVVAREDGPGGLRLIAYGDWDEGMEAALRETLQARLPAPMIPAAFVALATLPLTPSGKVDRHALAAIAPAAPTAPRGGGSPPATSTERELASLWRTVLPGADGAGGDIGREDNFFALGGHSLLAIQLIARLRSVFGVDLPLRRVFEHPTLAGLAAAMVREGAHETAWSEEPIPRRDLREAPLSSFQELQWRFEKERPGTRAYNLSSSHLLRGRLEADLLERCLAEVVRRHGALRTRIEERDGTAVQVVEPTVSFHLTRIDLGAIPAAERPAEAARLGVLEGGTGFDLRRAPLLRAALIRLAPEEHALLLSCHHIVSDGWSMGVLVGEITALYRAWGAGEPSPLPELPIQYTDYALWQRERLAGPAMEAQLAWWCARLRGWRPLELPLDRPRPATACGHLGKSVFGALPAARVDALREIGRGESASLFMLLLAAFELVLGRWCGQEDFLVGAPVAGRGRPETEPLIGYFVNLLPLRADLSGRLTFRQLLRRVRTAVLDAFANPDVPFVRLAEEAAADRPSLPPLVQAVLNVLSFPSSPVSPFPNDELPGGLQIEPLAAARLYARQDLRLQVSEAAEGLVLHAIYDAALFLPARMEELLRHYVHILDQAGRDPDALLSDLPYSEGIS